MEKDKSFRNKICIICESNFTWFYRDRFNISFYQKKNIKVEVYNVSKISRPSYFYLIQNQLNSNQKIITEENKPNDILNVALLTCLTLSMINEENIVIKSK